MGHAEEGSPASGQQGPTQGRASNGTGHGAHTVPQPQLRGREASVQQEEWEQAAGTLLTCGKNMSRCATASRFHLEPWSHSPACYYLPRMLKWWKGIGKLRVSRTQGVWLEFSGTT